ncbi:MAG: glycoside hydrolase family 16 protein [Clostridia bacterium]|nr:glycoside hydrolase family 16 protein [Clostridia bacterium]
MKKIAVFLCGLMLISVVGCNNQPATDTNTTTATTIGAQSTSATQEQTVGTQEQSTTVADTTANGQTTTKGQTTTNSVVATTTKGQVQQPIVTTTRPKLQLDISGANIKTVGGKMHSTISGKNYTLKWIDDFEGTTLNTNNWTPSNDANYNNGELNYKRPENIVVKDGTVTLFGKKENYKGKEYTGANMVSKNKVEYRYGKFEMLAKLPYGKGMWPAFWTMGVEEGWPWCGEIDIMEMIGDSDGGKWNFNGDSKFMATIHWCKPEATWETAYDKNKDKREIGFGSYALPGFVNSPDVTGIEKLADKFHIYGIEWSSTKIISYIDNIKVGEVDITDPTMRVAFHQPHYMLVNLSIGGRWPGAPDETTVFPQKYIIDWIKIWQ